MKLKYELNNSDFLEYQLYTASKSKVHKKKRRNSRIILPILYFLIGVYLLTRDRIYLAIVILMLGLLWFIFYPFYSRYRYKRHYKNHIKENYKNRVNTPVQLEFDSDFIDTIDYSAQSKIKASSFEKLVELQNHFFLTLASDQSLIIPKRVVTDQGLFKQKVSELNVEYVNELNWKWK